MKSFLVVITLILTIVLLGCGGRPTTPPAASLGPIGFINQTKHSDTDLWTIWEAAQQSVATRIDINPLQQSSSVAARILPGDARALSIEPHQLQVVAEADVRSEVLFEETGLRRNDPTGLIECTQRCNVRFDAAYSLYAPMVTRYAASWEFESNNFNELLQYEFENQILYALGYDMTWR